LRVYQPDIASGNKVDFNGDGRSDFIRQEKGAWDDDQYNTADVFFSNGNGTFAKYQLGDYFKGDFTNLIVGDFNGDGRSDFIRQEKGAWDDDQYNTADVFFSNGNGTFAKYQLGDYFKGDFTNLIVGDFNGDGRSDFIRQEKGAWDDDQYNTADVFFSNGNGTFAQYQLGDYFKGDFTNLIVGDFNGDGRSDFIRQEKGTWDDDQYNTADVFFSNGNGTFAKYQLGDYFKGDFTNLIIGDFNGDGRSDIIRQEKGAWDDDQYNTADVFFSNGNGTFAKYQLGDYFKGDFTNLIVGDFNGDGRSDIIRQEKGAWDDDQYNTADVFFSNGNGTFVKSELGDYFKGDFTNLIVGDFNGDGRSDIIRQEKGAWDDDQYNTADAFFSNGNGTFAKYQLGDYFKGDFTNIISNNSSVVASGYYSELSSLTEEQWDKLGGESAQFGSLANTIYSTGDKNKNTISDTSLQVYKDMSKAIFGTENKVNAGYGYDFGYYGTFGAHSGIDIQTSGQIVKSTINGVVAVAPFQYYPPNADTTKPSTNGWWMAIDEVNASGQKTGRRWWYGHLDFNGTNSSYILAKGTRVTAGQTTIARQVLSGQGHLHLTVTTPTASELSTPTGRSDYNNVANGKVHLNSNGKLEDGEEYTRSVNLVRGRTMNPLHAYWLFRNL
jgi:hypothetical protein